MKTHYNPWHLHKCLYFGPDTAVEAHISRYVRILLFDDAGYVHYLARLPAKHAAGGLYCGPVATVQPPVEGWWHVVIDSGGYLGPLTIEVLAGELE